MEKILPIIIISFVLILIYALFIFSRYHRCPADKLMVIYGRVGNDKNGEPRGFVCIHGGAAFIWPIIQSYKYLDLKPIKGEIKLKNALSKDNVFVEIDAEFTISISTEEGVRENAVECLLGLSHEEIHDITKDILVGNLRSLVKNKNAKELNMNNDEFMSGVYSNATDELEKIGIKPIRINFDCISTFGGGTEKQDLMNITGQNLADSKINKIELGNDKIIIYLNRKPDVNVIIKCIDYIGYELLGKRDNFTVSEILINDVDKSNGNNNALSDNPDSNWQQIHIKLLNGVEMKITCKAFEVYY
ncbi:flotillin family protein [Mycoplasmatota bacterium]|nr:flotillin family protein [Mycoplasmatota bacterium]